MEPASLTDFDASQHQEICGLVREASAVTVRATLEAADHETAAAHAEAADALTLAPGMLVSHWSYLSSHP